METNYMRDNDRTIELEDSLIAWQDKYDRLHESHKRVQKVNQSLEDKLLKLVDRNSGERAQLTGDVATLSVRLAQANYNIATLQREIERYKADMSLAIQLLQCKPENFVAQRVTSLPQEVQSKIAQYARLDSTSHSDSEGSTSGVGVATTSSYHALPASDSPISTCPLRSNISTYPMRGNDVTTGGDLTNNNNDMISASAMAKYLDDKLKASERKHCDTCSCANRDLTVLADTHTTYSISTQTMSQQKEKDNGLCLRCSSHLDSPSRSSSPFLLKIKSSDSVISETKSSISGIGSFEHKKDELVVNPILGHHRLCDRGTAKLIDISSSTTSSILANDSQTKLLSPTQAQIRDVPLNSKLGTSNIDNKSSSLRNSCMAKAGSSQSMSSKASSQTDGARIFENFNRNLIRSIKADNPKISGPRLCALRIQDGSSNILLDNIEAESCPVLYTQRSRLLDEELEGDKDVIASQSENGVRADQSVKISMLMSDGVECNTDVMYAQVQKAAGVTNTSTLDGYLDITNECNLSAKSNTMARTNQVAKNRSSNMHLGSYADIREAEGAARCDKYESESNICDGTGDLSQCRSPCIMTADINDSATFRRHQLTRVAQWIENNQVMDNTAAFSSSNEALSIDSGYKTKVTNSGNGAYIDRKTNSQSLNNNVVTNSGEQEETMFDVSDVKIFARNNYAQSNINNNDCGSIDVGSGSVDKIVDEDDDENKDDGSGAHVDLAQMEYNVKQFLLKQNEWARHRYSSTESHHSSRISNNMIDHSSEDAPSTRITTPKTHRTETNL